MSFQLNYKTVLFIGTFTTIQLCTMAGVYLPRFCYHKSLPTAANCRMCLVQLEDSMKPIAACAVVVVNGMRVLTDTALVKKARESVLEFLLINHPLDCPICDQGGECDLQDQTMVFGSDHGRFFERKRAVKDINLGHVIKTQMTRCIHCTRCVRFLQNLTKTNELGVLGRGVDMRIATFVKKPLVSFLSGNLADICPVGALTSKPYAFTARSWELTTYSSLDLNDAFGGNIRLDLRGDEIMRVLPYYNQLINDDWATDKARHSFDGVTKQRLNTAWFSFDTVKMTKTTIAEKILTKQLSYLLYKIVLDFFVIARLQRCNNVVVYLGTILDLDTSWLIKQFKQIVEPLVSFKMLDESNNEVSMRSMGTFRSNFLINALNENWGFTRCHYFGFNPEVEMPLFYFRLCELSSSSQQQYIMQPTMVNVKLNNYLKLHKEAITNGLTLAALYKLNTFDMFQKQIMFVGQAILHRHDIHSTMAFLHKVTSLCRNTEFKLAPANVTTLHSLEVG